MRRRFERLKSGLSGPAEKVAGAMKRGDFQQARKELDKLQEKLDKGELSQQEKQQLSRQLQDMAKKLEETVAAHENMKRELQKQEEKGSSKKENKGKRVPNS